MNLIMCFCKKFTLTSLLSLMLMAANFANRKLYKKPETLLEPLHMGSLGTHLRVLGESYPMNTNMTEF